MEKFLLFLVSLASTTSLAADRISYCNITKYSKSRGNGFNQAQNSTCQLSLSNVGANDQRYCVVYSSSTEQLTYNDGTTRASGTPTLSGSATGSGCTADSPAWETLTAGSTVTFTLTYDASGIAHFPAGIKNAEQKVTCNFTIYVQDADSAAGTVTASGYLTNFTENVQLHSSASGSGSYSGVALVNTENIECSQRSF